MQRPLSILLTVSLAAVAQAGPRPDRIVVSETTYAVCGKPLSTYLADRAGRPTFDIMSASASGYIATWTLRDDTLYLTDIHGTIGNRKVTIPDLFQGRTGPVKSTWFSGNLRLQQVVPGQRPCYGNSKQFILTFKQGTLLPANGTPGGTGVGRQTPLATLVTPHRPRR